MAYLLDTDAISELLRPRPLAAYVAWIATVGREDQFASAISIGEMYRGAFRSEARARHVANIEDRVLPAVTVLPFDVAVARRFGWLHAGLERRGEILPDADLQIAATALEHDLDVVTGNVRHFRRIEGLKLHPILGEARRSSRPE